MPDSNTEVNYLPFDFLLPMCSLSTVPGTKETLFLGLTTNLTILDSSSSDDSSSSLVSSGFYRSKLLFFFCGGFTTIDPPPPLLRLSINL